jgi:hypothetical protein
MKIVQISTTDRFVGDHTGYYRYEFGIITGNSGAGNYIVDFGKRPPEILSILKEIRDFDGDYEEDEYFREDFSVLKKECNIIGVFK